MKRTRFFLLYFAAWLPAAALYAFGVASQPGTGIADATIAATITTLVAALLGLGAWYAAPRIARRDGNTGKLRGLLFHALGAAAYTVVWNGFVLAQIAAFAPPAAFTRYLYAGLGFQLLTGIALYAVVAGVSSYVAAARAAREQQEIAARAETLRVQAELRALRAQLDPHFLFNTLHTITSLVRSDQARVETALQQLADLLRYVLAAHEGRGEEVALEDEVRFVRAYLELENLRFGNRLRVEWHVSDDAAECVVLSFTLQPLVENAVRHAVARTVNGATIRISAQVNGDNLLLVVKDNGPGAPEDISGGGVGLRAVKQRILARFGDRSSFEVTTSQGKGFSVAIRIPAILARREAPGVGSSLVARAAATV